MTVKLAYKMCVGIFKQDSTGSVLGSLPDPFKSTKWNLTSIIPTAYDYTNFQVGDTTVETIETNTITQLTKARQYDSGAVTPPTLNLATLLPADAATIIATLDALDVDDPYKILVCAGHYKSVSDSVRTYDVFHAVNRLAKRVGSFFQFFKMFGKVGRFIGTLMPGRRERG